MKATQLRVLSYNIHKGFSLGNAKFVLHQLKEAIHKTGADIVFLQEVLGEHSGHKEEHSDWPAQSQFEFLADSLWPHFAYGKNAIYLEGHHGNVILSRYPFLKWENIDISTNRLERRGLLHGVVECPGLPEPLHVACVHLNLLEASRKQQVELVCERLRPVVTKDAPLILAGDFNDWTTNVSKILTQELQLNEAYRDSRGHYARTFPSWFPLLTLDRIYCRGFQITDVHSLRGKPWTDLSDHLPLLADLKINVAVESQPA